jgi:hypothetical protein
MIDVLVEKMFRNRVVVLNGFAMPTEKLYLLPTSDEHLPSLCLLQTATPGSSHIVSLSRSFPAINHTIIDSASAAS